jgi:hypothetical protein
MIERYLNPRERKDIEKVFNDIFDEKTEKQKIRNDYNIITSVHGILVVISFTLLIIGIINKNIECIVFSYAILFLCLIFCEWYNNKNLEMYKKFKEELNK